VSATDLAWTVRQGLEALDVVLFRLGDARITPGLLLKLVLLLILVFWAAGALRRWLLGAGLRRFDIDTGTRHAVASTARYLMLVLGVLMVLQNVGINLAALSVVAGAVGVGVGFGLQNVVSNFISGLIIMFERPIKVGDRVEVGGIEGEVREISARRTTVVSSDNVAILIPNQRFILDNVVNLAYLDAPVRLRVAVGLVPGTDAAVVERALLEAARELPGVLPEPPPAVLMKALGGAAQQFELAVWFHPARTARDQLASALNLAVARRLAKAEVKQA
jgi:small-conductance mechanosensitive channel